MSAREDPGSEPRDAPRSSAPPSAPKRCEHSCGQLCWRLARHAVSGILKACAGRGRALGGGAGAPVSPRRCSGWRTARSLRLAAVLGQGCGAWAGRAGSAALTWRGSVTPRRPALQETLFSPPKVHLEGVATGRPGAGRGRYAARVSRASLPGGLRGSGKMLHVLVLKVSEREALSPAVHPLPVQGPPRLGTRGKGCRMRSRTLNFR